MQQILSRGGELNTDLSDLVLLRTHEMEWERVPGTSVLEKRLDHLDDLQTGRETSLMRFEPNTTLPAETLEARVEILVLDGTYSDGHGDYGKGTYLLNSPGFTHTPASEEGCDLHVQRRRGFGAERERVVIDTQSAEWIPRFTGKMVKLYEDDAQPEEMHIGRMPPGQKGAFHDHPGGEEVLILEGAMADENAVFDQGTWLRFPGSFRHETISKDGCLMYVREGDVG